MDDEDSDETKKYNFKCVVLPIKNIIRGDKSELINTAVKDVNMLVRDIYDFMHLHYLRLYEIGIMTKLPLTQNNIRVIADILCEKSESAKSRNTFPEELKDTFKIFDKIRRHEPIVRTRYDRIIMDVCTDICTSYTNNITLHMFDRIVKYIFERMYIYEQREKDEKYIEACIKNKKPVDYIKINKKKREIRSDAYKITKVLVDPSDTVFNYNLKKYKEKIKKELNEKLMKKLEGKLKIKEKIILRNKFKEDLDSRIEKYRDAHKEEEKNTNMKIEYYKLNINELRSKILPKNIKKSFYYDVVKNPTNYISGMIYMNRWLEVHLCEQFKCFPNRNINELKYIPISTSGIENLYSLSTVAKKYDVKLNNGIKTTPTSNPNFYWNEVFNLNTKIFRQKLKKAKCINSIRTDGIGVSICFYYGLKKKTKVTKYLDDYTKKELKSIIKDKNEVRNVVYIDPGKDNLITCMCKRNETCEYFRYTSRQRRFEIKTKYIKELNKKLTKKIFETNEGIKDIYESFNHKTCYEGKFILYLCNKYEYEEKVCSELYKIKRLRKNKLRGKIYKKRATMKLIDTLKDKFGEDAIMIYGDWSGKCNLKNTAPTIRDSLRKDIKKRFKMIMIDEYNTSKISAKTREETSNLKRSMKRIPLEGGNPVYSLTKIHQILEYKIRKVSGGTLVQSIGRDKNAVQNFARIMEAKLKGKMRPKELCPAPSNIIATDCAA